MHMKIARKFAQAVPLVVMSMVASTVMAIQTVTPYTAASGGSSIAAANVPAGTTFTFYGRYEIDAGSTANESGLGIKVKYDNTKFSAVVVDQVYTKCMIASPDQQESVPATSQVVFGWIDTSVRRTTGTPNGVVGWPGTADPAAPGATDGCLNPGSIVVDQAGVTPPLSLFRVQMTTLAGFTSGTTQVDLVSDGNYSYAGTTPGYTNKSIVLTAAAAPLCNLDVDGDGLVLAAKDGVLLQRALNPNISDANVVAGIAITGSRTTGAQIRAYLNTFMSGVGVSANLGATVLDIDSNASTTAAVDGNAIKRALNVNISAANVVLGLAVAPGTTGQSVRQKLNQNCSLNLPTN